MCPRITCGSFSRVPRKQDESPSSSHNNSRITYLYLASLLPHGTLSLHSLCTPPPTHLPPTASLEHSKSPVRAQQHTHPLFREQVGHGECNRIDHFPAPAPCRLNQDARFGRVSTDVDRRCARLLTPYTGRTRRERGVASNVQHDILRSGGFSTQHGYPPGMGRVGRGV